MCRFKFRLWNCLSYSQNSETAGLHKAIINIKRSRRQAVTALNIIVIVNYPFEKHYILASLVKGRWIDGKAQVLILLLSACDMPIIFMLQTFCRQDGGIASPPPFAPHQPFQNRTITLTFRRGVGLPLPLHRPFPFPQPLQKDNNPSPRITFQNRTIPCFTPTPFP